MQGGVTVVPQGINKGMLQLPKQSYYTGRKEPGAPILKHMENLKNLTQAELDNELKQDRLGEKEQNDLINDIFMNDVMEKIEERRKELRKDFPVYTQKYVAEKAFISLSTYKNYISGYNTSFSLRMLKNIADILGCKPSDFLD